MSTPSKLPELVKTAFAKALAAGELHFFPTQVTILPVGSIPFQLRFSPALANKTKPTQSSSSRPPVAAEDPFAHPPPALFITDLGPTHFLVLNKFAIVPEHFILATRAFRQQQDVLDESDLDATRSCVRAYWDAGGAELFAFFNCGEHSGASQPHRHIQLLPVERMRDGLQALDDDGDVAKWSVLADRADDLHRAPFVVVSEPIRLDMSASELYGVYLRLYRSACRAAGVSDDGDASPPPPSNGPSLISYNLAMTTTCLAICPRQAEGGPVYGSGRDQVGTLALNGTLLAGTALVKTEAEWHALRNDPAALEDVLRRIGLSRDASDESRV